jgi:hypothetical protein
MSCCGNDGPLELFKNRENVIQLTVYEDDNETVLEDLTGKTFSGLIQKVGGTETYATAVGEGQVAVDLGNSVISLTFAADEFSEADWDQAEYVVDDITDVGNPKPFLRPSLLTLTTLQPAAVPTP